MKFSYSMLRDMVETELSAEQIGDLLTMAGFELEGIEEVEGEPVLDIKVVSNRGDGLSVLGLAREVLAKDPDARPTLLYTRSAARFPEGPKAPTPQALVTIECPECSRYACFVVERISNGDAPEWVQKRIRQAGWRPISLLVDLTNYVMLEQGQPLHAFDLGKLHGERIVVRHAREGEKLTTLDGVEHELKPGQMMICDADHPVAAAGIMGGMETEVSGATTRMLLESAHFLNTSVRRTRKQLSLSTEASYRFERSVDPEGVVAALHRVLELLVEVQPSVSVTGFADVYPSPPNAVSLDLSVERASRLLGMDISPEQAGGYLKRLGFGVEWTSGTSSPPNPPQGGLDSASRGLSVSVPSWRPDVVREEDLVEELGRVHGYDKIPAVLPQGTTTQGGVFGFEAFVDRIREECVRLGLQQIISHSLRDLHPLDAPGERIGPRNPGSPEMAYLRNSLLPGLADAAKRNGNRDIHAFEIGRVFLGSEVNDYAWSANDGRDNPIWNPHPEVFRLAILSQGQFYSEDWLMKPARTDFFWLSSMLQQACGAVRDDVVDMHEPERPDPRLHPTRQATLSSDHDDLAILGQIHPDVAEATGLPEDTFLADVDLRQLWAASEYYFLQPVSRQPGVRRDMAVLIDKAVPYKHLHRQIKSAIGEVLEKIWLFDVYEGQGIPEGKHSLGIALQLRKQDSTFTDEEANQVRERAVKAIEALGATTR